MKKLLLIIACFFLVACSSTPKNQENTATPTAAQPKNKVVVGISQDFDSLDPHKASATGTQEVMFNIFTGLVNTLPSGEIVPELSTEYEVSDDLMTYTFKLRDDVVFHDGSKMTSKDVAYSYNRLIGKTDDQTEPLSAELSTLISSVDTPDDYTVVFNLTTGDASFLSKCLNAIIPVNSGATQATNPVGAGPYKFDSYTAGIGIKMKKNESFYQEGLPKLEEVEFKIFADANAGQLAMENGEIQIMSMPIANAKAMSANFNTIDAPQNMVQLMALNHEFEPFSKLEVRQAINYAIDKQEIINALSPGSEQLDTNFSPVMEFYYNDQLKNYYPRDVEKAKELLKAANEENLSFTITVPSEYTLHVDTATIIQQQLAEAGITVNIETIEWNSWLEDIYKNEKYEATVIGFTGKIDPHPIIARYRTDYNRNFVNYSNAEFDDLMKQATQTKDANTRADIYKQAQENLTKNAVSVFIMDPSIHVVVDKNITGYTTYPIGYIDMKNVSYQ